MVFNGGVLKSKFPWRFSAAETAKAFVHGSSRYRASVQEVGAGSIVVLTSPDLPEGAVRNERYVVHLGRGSVGDGRWLAGSYRRLVRCRAGCGHRDFSPQPCRWATT
jgi:hypothetical protein